MKEKAMRKSNYVNIRVSDVELADINRICEFYNKKLPEMFRSFIQEKVFDMDMRKSSEVCADKLLGGMQEISGEPHGAELQALCTDESSPCGPIPRSLIDEALDAVLDNDWNSSSESVGSLAEYCCDSAVIYKVCQDRLLKMLEARNATILFLGSYADFKSYFTDFDSLHGTFLWKGHKIFRYSINSDRDIHKCRGVKYNAIIISQALNTFQESIAISELVVYGIIIRKDGC